MSERTPDATAPPSGDRSPARRPDTAHPADEMNALFYERFADAFANKRRHPWAGWRRLPIPAASSAAPRIRILDVGCGHGRFLAHWLAEDLPPVDYVGVDFSGPLLARAEAEAKPRAGDRVRFRRGTVPGLDLAPPGTDRFHGVFAFGLLHHIAGPARRHGLVCALGNAAAPGGTVVVTVWRFGKEPRFRGRGRPPPQEIAAEEPRAVVLDFDGEGERLCVDVPDAEIDRWGSGNGLNEVDRFEADGRSGALNLYLVFRRDDDQGAGSEIPSAFS